MRVRGDEAGLGGVRSCAAAAAHPPLKPPPSRHARPLPRPQSYIAAGESRPVIEKIEDELDQWGRPKKALRTPIDALPPDAQAKALEQLAKREGEGAGSPE